jgi:hypothetical protein
VKQTINIPVATAILVNKANIKIPIVDWCMHEQNFFLLMINMN